MGFYGNMLCHWGNMDDGAMGGYGMGYGMGWLGGIVMLAFWALVIIGLVFLIRWIAASTKVEGRGETPLDILKKRYAKGEINKEEFDAKKKDLE